VSEGDTWVPAPDLQHEVRTPAAEPFLLLDQLNKYFGSHHVIKDLTLGVEEGEILALLGPSGSGKTTVLRLLAGFERPDVGRVVVDGEDVTLRQPAKRGFGMVFQSYALFPHMSVGENLAFGLESAGFTREEVQRRVAEMLSLTDLKGFEARRVSEISGGQQQRVALARALAPQPKVLMLDEPLSNLDPSLRERTRRELRRLIKAVGITTFVVTHEQEEAFDLGDRVGVLRDGRLEQVASPRELYELPRTSFVATFVGRAAVLQGVVEAVVGERRRVRLLGEGSEAGIADWWALGEVEASEAVDLVIRPESLAFVEAKTVGAVGGRVLARRYTGPGSLFRIGLDLGVEVEVEAPPDRVTPGQRVWVAPQRDRLPPRIFARSRGVVP